MNEHPDRPTVRRAGSRDAAAVPVERADDLREYTAEPPVDMRAQRLRRVDPDDAAPADEDTRVAATDPDPYGVAVVEHESAAADLAAAAGSGRTRGRLGERTADVPDPPATWGLRGRLNAGLGLHLTARDDERRFRESERRVTRALPGFGIITVLGNKGGVGKTPTSIVLASRLAQLRRDRVVLVDASASAGTLGDRVVEAADENVHVWSLLDHARALVGTDAEPADLGRYLVRQPTGEELLAGDATDRGRRMGYQECRAVAALVRRHRDMLVVDTGSDSIHSEVFDWAADHSDVVVVPMPLREDAAYDTLRTLDAIAARGGQHLFEALRILVAPTHGADPALVAAVSNELALLGVPADAVIEVPVDPVFGAGRRLDPRRLAPPTVEAYTNIAGEIVDLLADRLTDRHRVTAHSRGASMTGPETGWDVSPPHSDAPAGAYRQHPSTLPAEHYSGTDFDTTTRRLRGAP